MARRILLFHPASEGPYLPLALLAIAGKPALAGFRVDIVDASIHHDYAARLRALAPEALCFGATVLTGRSILGAVEATRLVRASNPSIPVVWGGWHASIMPEQCLEQADVAVIGQGEETFFELVQRLDTGTGIEGCAGTCIRSPEGPRRMASRPLADMNRLPAVNYDLLDPEAYFAAKGARQIEYLSSFGCSFHCTFCADPLVVRQRWTGLEPTRVVDEIEALTTRHRIDDMIFADDHFFNNPERVAQICRGLAQLPSRPHWFATARADVFAAHCRRFTDLLAPAGCRTLFFGIESGDEGVRKRMGKGIKRSDLLRVARMCEERGIQTNFTYIVGLPGETRGDLRATLREAATLRLACERASTKLFYYSPYPGTQLFEEAAKRGMVHPRGLLEWGRYGDHDAAKPWLSVEYRRRVEIASFYHAHMNARGEDGRAHTSARRVLRALARARGRTGFYLLPVEYAASRLLRARSERSGKLAALALKEAT